MRLARFYRQEKREDGRRGSAWEQDEVEGGETRIYGPWFGALISHCWLAEMRNEAIIRPLIGREGRWQLDDLKNNGNMSNFDRRENGGEAISGAESRHNASTLIGADLAESCLLRAFSRRNIPAGRAGMRILLDR